MHFRLWAVTTGAELQIKKCKTWSCSASPYGNLVTTPNTSASARWTQPGLQIRALQFGCASPRTRRPQVPSDSSFIFYLLCEFLPFWLICMYLLLLPSYFLPHPYFSFAPPQPVFCFTLSSFDSLLGRFLHTFACLFRFLSYAVFFCLCPSSLSSLITYIFLRFLLAVSDRSTRDTTCSMCRFHFNPPACTREPGNYAVKEAGLQNSPDSCYCFQLTS